MTADSTRLITLLGHRRIGVDEGLRRQHRPMPGAQILHAVVRTDEFLEARVEVVRMEVRPPVAASVRQQPVATPDAAQPGPHHPRDVGVLELHRALNAALRGIVEGHDVAAHLDVFAQQRRQAVGLVLLRVLLAARAKIAAVEQVQCQREHPLLLQAAPREVRRDALAPLRQPGGHLQDAVELLLGPFVLPGLVIEVLAAARDIRPHGLDVSVRVGTDPHLLPRRRDHQLLDALQRSLVSQGGSVRCAIGEALAATLTGDSRPL